MTRSRHLTLALAATAALATAVSAATAGATTEPLVDDDAIVVDDALVDAARSGLAGWIEVNRPPTPTTSTNLQGCPAIDVTVLIDVLGEHGVEIDPLTSDWGTEIEWNEYERLSPTMIGIACGGDADGDSHDTPISAGFGVLAVELVDGVTIEELATWSGFPLEFVDGPHGDTASTCVDVGDRFCLTIWHRDGLVVGLILVNDGAPADEAALDTIAAALVPQILATLADAEPTAAIPAP